MQDTEQKGGFWSQKILDSKVKSPYAEKKEKVFGYVLGPVGGAMLNFLFAGYLNIYYTNVLKLTEKGDFLFLFPLLSGILVVVFNLLFGYWVDHTYTKQGKARPYLFLSAFLLTISAILLFAIPTDNEGWELALVVISYNLFYSIAYAMYNTAHALMVPLSSRNSVERTGLSTFSNIGMMAGQLIISAIFPTFVYSNIGLDKKLWFFAMLGFALLAFPMELCEYFFTKERVTQEQEKNEIKEEKIKTSAQLKVCVKDKYWWLMMLYFLFFYLGLAMKNASVNYYCDWVLGKPQDSTTIMLFNVVGGSSIFLGLFIIGALQKKFTKRSQLMVGFIFYSLGDLLCWIFPTNLPVVLVGQFIKNAGAIPCIFIVLSLYSDVLDHLEWKAGFRCDGVSTAIYSIMVIFFPILGTSVFNKLLYSFGYDSSLTSQSTSCQQMLTACCVGVETITAAIIAVLFVFFDVEKGLKEKQAEIINRQKEKVLAQGGTWIDPAERAKQEQADLEKAREEERVAALKEKCQKKGLDYEKEEAAYQTKKQAKETKKKGKK